MKDVGAAAGDTVSVDRCNLVDTYNAHDCRRWVLPVLFISVIVSIFIIIVISSTKIREPVRNMSILAPTRTPSYPPPTAPISAGHPTAFKSLTSSPTVDQTCGLADYPSATTDWMTYTNTNHRYSFKYPREAITFFNNHSDAPQDYNDVIYIPEPSSTKIIPAFSLSIITLKNSPEEFDYNKTALSKVDQAGGDWRNYNEIIRRVTFIDKPGYISYHMYRDVNNATSRDLHIKVFSDDTLFDLVLDEREQSVACRILSTFKFT